MVIEIIHWPVVLMVEMGMLTKEILHDWILKNMTALITIQAGNMCSIFVLTIYLLICDSLEYNILLIQI